MKAPAKGGKIVFLLKMKQLIDMAARTLKIATRKSPLAMWQANFVKDRLEALYPELQVELVPMSTQGDKILDTPLAKVGGKGLFVKELETAMLEGRADIAVHSMKDVPVEFPEGLGLHTICEREDPRDAFVSNRFTAIDELPQGAVSVPPACVVSASCAQHVRIWSFATCAATSTPVSPSWTPVNTTPSSSPPPA